MNPRSPPLVPAYELDAVSQSRGGRTLLDHVSVALPAGGATALIGPSGSGKTTLLRLLNRLDDPTSGTIRCLGQPITAYPVRELRLRAGFVFQAPAMFAGTVADNLAVAAELAAGRAGEKPVDPQARQDRIDEVLRLVQLDPGFAAREASGLSGGEKQRVALARALMHAPGILLLDEPTAALDPEVADRLIETLRHLRETAGLTIVMVTHRLREARLAGTFVVMLEAGRLLEAGPAEQVLNAPQHERTRAFLAAGDGTRSHGT